MTQHVERGVEVVETSPVLRAQGYPEMPTSCMQACEVGVGDVRELAKHLIVELVNKGDGNHERRKNRGEVQATEHKTGDAIQHLRALRQNGYGRANIYIYIHTYMCKYR